MHCFGQSRCAIGDRRIGRFLVPISRRSAGRPARRAYVHCFAAKRRCQRSSVPGVMMKDRQKTAMGRSRRRDIGTSVWINRKWSSRFLRLPSSRPVFLHPPAYRLPSLRRHLPRSSSHFRCFGLEGCATVRDRLRQSPVRPRSEVREVLHERGDLRLQFVVAVLCSLASHFENVRRVFGHTRMIIKRAVVSKRQCQGSPHVDWFRAEYMVNHQRPIGSCGPRTS
jgi:hypothetical protein